MGYITISELRGNAERYSNTEAELRGWARSLRVMGGVGFIELNDGSDFNGIQIVLSPERLANFAELTAQNVGASLRVTGVFTLTPNAKQPFELQASSAVVEGASSPDYPLQKKRHSVEFLREIAHLRPRTNLFGAVFRVRSVASFAIHSFFTERGFIFLHAPIITKSDAEGAGAMFRVSADAADAPQSDASVGGAEFFGDKTALTVSGQLEAETFALAFGKTYTFGPTFRAENSNTPRHAAEFWMVEPEIAFAELSDDMALAEDFLKFVLSAVIERCPAELEFLDKFVSNGLLERLHAAINAEFAAVTYTEAVEILKKSGKDFKFPVSWGVDLQTEHERYLAEEFFKRPVFVTDYPKEIKAFYMRLNTDGKTVAAMDLLAPGVGEIIGGSQREERLDVLETRMDELNMDKAPYWWYFDLRRYGGAKHAGFGLGFERLLMYVTGVSNIRDVIPYPRVTGSAEF
jgi:asparaginyl-tRNA synthetase